MGSGGKSPTTTSNSTMSQNTASTTEPLPWASNIAQEGLNRANQLASAAYSPYPWVPVNPFDRYSTAYKNILTGANTNDVNAQPYQSGVAPMTEQQKFSLGQISNYANSYNPIMDTSMTQLANTMGGGYLSPESNPYLAQYAQQALGDVSRNYQNSVVPQLSASAQRAGAFGGSSDALLRSEAMKNYGDTLSKTATGIYEPAYENERTRQMQAEFFAPQAMQMPIQLATAGLGAGDAYQQQQQNEINDLMNRWQQQIQWPYQTSQVLTSAYPAFTSGTGRTYGSSTGTQQTTATTSPGSVSPLSNIFGGAVGGVGSGLLAAGAGLNPYAAAGLGGLTFLSSLFK